MATQPTGRVVEALAAPQHQVPLTVRDLRGQAVQRLQAGLFGLAAMLLMIGLANIVLDRARLGDSASSAGRAQTAAAQQKTDPLADIGVVPSAAPAPATAATQAPAGK